MTFIETSEGVYLNAEVIALIELTRGPKATHDHLLITTKNGKQYTIANTFLVKAAITALKLKE